MPGPQRDTYGPGSIDPSAPSLPAPQPYEADPSDGRFVRQLAEVIAWQEVNTALYALRKIADLLGVYEDGWGGDTIQQIGRELATELERLNLRVTDRMTP